MSLTQEEKTILELLHAIEFNKTPHGINEDSLKILRDQGLVEGRNLTSIGVSEAFALRRSIDREMNRLTPKRKKKTASGDTWRRYSVIQTVPDVGLGDN